MTCQIIIPARVDSQRLPGKLLLEKRGVPLVAHTARRALETGLPVTVATDSVRIAQAVDRHTGAEVVWTGQHESGTSRVREAAQSIDASRILNWQADEPELDPLDAVRLMRSDAEVTTLCYPSWDRDEASSPSVVKVLVASGRAMWFTRALVPFSRTETERPWLLHSGIYCYRREWLLGRMPEIPPSHYAEQESLEQLHWVAAGERVAVVVGRGERARGIDTREDYLAWIAR